MEREREGMESGGKGSKGKEASGSEEREAEAEVERASGKGKKKEKKRDRRRAKLFQPSTATLAEVRSLDVLLKFNPLPNQRVLLDVPEDVDVREFVSISRYAEHQGYTILNERAMMRLMLQRLENMQLTKEEGAEETLRRARRGSDDEGEGGGGRGGRRGSSPSSSCSTTCASQSTARTSRSA